VTQRVDSGGIEVAFEVHGEGDPLVCIMGIGYSRHDWRWTLPALSRHFQTIIFDNRCMGDTGCPENEFTMRDIAEDVVAILDRLAIDSAHVFGVSMGGFVAQEMAINHPDRVRCLILGATHLGLKTCIPLSEETMKHLTSTFDDPEQRIRQRMPYSLRPGWVDEHPGEFEEIVRQRLPHQPSDEKYARLYAAALTQDTAERVGGIKAPTLVLQGTADRVVPPENARLIAEAIPGARVEWLQGAGHLFFIEEPEKLAGLIAGFCTQFDSHQATGGQKRA